MATSFWSSRGPSTSTFPESMRATRIYDGAFPIVCTILCAASAYHLAGTCLFLHFIDTVVGVFANDLGRLRQGRVSVDPHFDCYISLIVHVVLRSSPIHSHDSSASTALPSHTIQ